MSRLRPWLVVLGSGPPLALVLVAFTAGRVSSGGGGAAGGSSSVASLARLSDGAFVSGAKAHLSKRKAIDFVNYSVRPFGFLVGHE